MELRTHLEDGQGLLKDFLLCLSIIVALAAIIGDLGDQVAIQTCIFSDRLILGERGGENDEIRG